jgi:hypothetical protein
MTARLGAVRHIRQTPAEWLCSEARDEKIKEKFTLFSRGGLRAKGQAPLRPLEQIVIPSNRAL